MTQERKSVNQTESQRKFFAIPGLAKVMDTIDIKTANNPILHNLFLENRGTLTDYYNAVFYAATGRGYRKLNKFKREFEKDQNSPRYNPELIKLLDPHISIIKNRIYGPLSIKK